MNASTAPAAPAPPVPPLGGESGPAGVAATAAAGLRYGALGLPLAFVALPLYVLLPSHYATVHGVPLATLGTLLLAARLLDAIVDPAIGLFADRLLGGARRRLFAVAAAAAALLAASFAGLFFPLPRAGAALLLWCAALLTSAYLGYSVLALLHQAWGARLGGDASQRARIVAWREGLALAGVIVASVLPSLAGLGATSAVLAAALVLALLLLARAPRPSRQTAPQARGDWRAPLATPAFRSLLRVYLVNGVAGAVPATLLLFFVRDRLQAPAWEPAFLAGYFAAGALAMPAWIRVVGRVGLARAWLAGIVLAIAAFVWAATLGAGDAAAFAAVCVASGIALGADLALPGALLAGVVARAGHGGREGAYFGWWNFATKLNLALAAGLALPLLGAFGYAPGARDPTALAALTTAYCLLPCALKAAAAALLLRHRARFPEENER